MKYSSIDSSAVVAELRLDARRFVTGGQWSSSVKTITLGDLVGENNIWKPGRITQIVASTVEWGKPYLAPWDTLRYFPRSKTILSKLTKGFESCEVERGNLLLTCSGRNLGPAVMVDGYLERFVVSSDMIRISGAQSDELRVAYAAIMSNRGQKLLRVTRSGSVIDHLSVSSVRELPIPLLADEVLERVSQGVLEAFLLRERARESIEVARESFARATGLSAIDSDNALERRRFQICVSELTNLRLDAEPHAPSYRNVAKTIEGSKHGVQISELAALSRPAGRYRTVYVEPSSDSIPMLSTRHMAQYRPVGLKYINPVSFSNAADYQIVEGTLLMAADGRAEDNLGDTILVAFDRSGWAASGHVIRINAKPPYNSGCLYLAMTTPSVAAIIKSRATGSVVDALSIDEINALKIPYPADRNVAVELGNQVSEAWAALARATEIERIAFSVFDEK